MKRKRFIRVSVLSMTLILALLLLGCSEENSNNDIMEEPEITVEYLSTEYAEQILRDGGEEILGTVELAEKSGGNYELTINSMVIVESSITEEGYYVADKNMSSSVTLDPDVRLTYIKSKKKGPEIIGLEEFAGLAKKDAQAQKGSIPEPGKEKLYQVYIIGGNAVMLLAKELPDV